MRDGEVLSQELFRLRTPTQITPQGVTGVSPNVRPAERDGHRSEPREDRVNPSEEPSPYGNAHALLTDAASDASLGKPATRRLDGAVVQPNHGSTARDDVTPKTPAGQPLFAPVWQYVCFA